MMISMFTEKNRPFYRSTHLMQLDPIELESYKDFVRHHFVSNNKSFDGKAFEDIYTWSRQQTYCTQLVCNKVSVRYNGLNYEILYDVISSDSGSGKPCFSGYTKLLTHMQWKVLSAVVARKNHWLVPG